MSETLFEGWEPQPPSKDPALSADRRRTLRQAELIAAGIHPITRGRLHPLASRHRDASAPKNDPFTCGSCYFREVFKYHGKAFPKCVRGSTVEAGAPFVTHSAATDVRAWWPACVGYSPGANDVSHDAARNIPDGAP